MSNVIKRVRTGSETVLEQRLSVHTPNFPTGTWVINPDLSTVQGGGVPEIYWKNDTADLIEEMTAPEKAVIDQLLLDQDIAAKTAAVISPQDPFDPLAGLVTSVVTDGFLEITTNVDVLLVDDITTIVADTVVTKFVRVSYEYDEAGDILQLTVYERLDPAQIYTPRGPDIRALEDLAEYSLVANGASLVLV